MNDKYLKAIEEGQAIYDAEQKRKRDKEDKEMRLRIEAEARKLARDRAWFEREFHLIVKEQAAKGEHEYTTRDEVIAKIAGENGFKVKSGYKDDAWDEGVNFGGYYYYTISW
jgi:hypothetical protein